MMKCIGSDHGLDFGERDQWDVYIPYIAATHNNRYSKRIGMTPSEAYRGRKVRLPVDANAELINMRNRGDIRRKYVIEYNDQIRTMRSMNVMAARLRLEKYDRQRKEYYERNRKRPDWKPGFKVFVWDGARTGSKRMFGTFKSQWTGPYPIVKVFNDGANYTLRGDDGTTFNMPLDRLRPYHARDDDPFYGQRRPRHNPRIALDEVQHRDGGGNDSNQQNDLDIDIRMDDGDLLIGMEEDGVEDELQIEIDDEADTHSVEPEEQVHDLDDQLVAEVEAEHVRHDQAQQLVDSENVQDLGDRQVEEVEAGQADSQLVQSENVSEQNEHTESVQIDEVDRLLDSNPITAFPETPDHSDTEDDPNTGKYPLSNEVYSGDESDGGESENENTEDTESAVNQRNGRRRVGKGRLRHRRPRINKMSPILERQKEEEEDERLNPIPESLDTAQAARARRQRQIEQIQAARPIEQKSQSDAQRSNGQQRSQRKRHHSESVQNPDDEDPNQLKRRKLRLLRQSMDDLLSNHRQILMMLADGDNQEKLESPQNEPNRTRIATERGSIEFHLFDRL